MHGNDTLKGIKGEYKARSQRTFKELLKRILKQRRVPPKYPKIIGKMLADYTMSNESNRTESPKKCKMCGECCINLTENGKFCLPISKTDAKYLQQLPLFKKYLKAGKIVVLKGEYDLYYPFDLVADGLCPFFDPETKLCQIYSEYRPAACVKFQCPD